MNSVGDFPEEVVSLEQLQAAFESGVATSVHRALSGFLRAEWRSGGDTQVVNDIASWVGRAMYEWFRTCEAMDNDSQRAIYEVLRPDGALFETLLQYKALQRQRADRLAGDAGLAIGSDSFPDEWRGPGRAAAVAAYVRAHAPKSVRLLPAAGGCVELRVGAVEYVIYHIMRALVAGQTRHGALVAGSAAHRLGRAAISYFMPVATGGGSADALDACDPAQAEDVARFFVFAAAFVWLPSGADTAVTAWQPRVTHVVALNLFHAVVGYVAKGDRQAERAGAGDAGPVNAGADSVRAALRAIVRRLLAAPLTALLALVVRGDIADGDAWLPFADEAVATWIRFAMPWRGGRAAPDAWRSRVSLVVCGVGLRMYGPVLTALARRLSAPDVDLLAHAPPSSIDNASALAHLRGADALGIVERLASAFAVPELRAILVAAERAYGVAGSTRGPARFEALVAETEADVAAAVGRETNDDGGCALGMLLFSAPDPALLASLVRALQRADRLCARQLRLLQPPPPSGAAAHAQSLVAELFAAAARALGPEPPVPDTHALHDAQARIATAVPKIATVFHASRAEIDALMRDPVPFVLGDPTRKRSAPAVAASPDMDRGALTPRGRWELKTGRRKFTAASLLVSPDGDASSCPADDDLLLLLPRGPRAVITARSYENQWLLDHALGFNSVANRYFQLALDTIESRRVFPIPHALRSAHLDFRWVAAYPNMRFLALVLSLLLLMRWLLF